MRLLIFTTTFLLFQAVNFQPIYAQSWLKGIKSKIKETVEQKIVEEAKDAVDSQNEETDQKDMSTSSEEPKQSSTQSVKDPAKLDLYGGHNAPWNVAHADSKKVLDIKIKGMRLGMPEVLINDILVDEGFEKIGYNVYSKDLVEINGQQEEVTRSQQRGKSVEEKGKLIKRYTIEYQTVAVDDETMNEFDDSLKALIKNGKKKFNEIKEKYTQQQGDYRGQRGERKKIEYEQFPVDTSAFKLVYSFSYTQSFANGSQYDQASLMAQIRDLFGPPTYAPESVHARDGSAFGTNELNWLIYHDAAFAPVAQREELLVGVDKKGDRWAMKNSFSHPCGASPYNNMNCVAAPITSAYDTLSRRLEAARIIYAPVMMVQFQSPIISTKLAWEYIKSAESIRDYYNKNNAYQKLPKAKADF
ncbi:MAG: hypothetical protein K9G26_06910 [Emcibacter sp.]|nr:hypothetical protein [Emcibacter sp.]